MKSFDTRIKKRFLRGKMRKLKEGKIPKEEGRSQNESERKLNMRSLDSYQQTPRELH